MKKFLIIIIFLLLTACKSDTEGTKDYGKLMESSVTERYHINGGNEELITILKTTFNDHNKATEVSYYMGDETLVFTQFIGYDEQDRITTSRTIDNSKNLEVKHQYGTTDKLQTTVFEYGELVSTVDYIYYTEDNHISNVSDVNGDLTHTNETTMISEGVYTTLSKDLEFGTVTLTQITYDAHDNLIEVITSVDDVLIDRYENVYDEHDNMISRKRYLYVKDGDVLLSTDEFIITYDAHKNVIKKESLSQGIVSDVSITTITYKE